MKKDVGLFVFLFLVLMLSSFFVTAELTYTEKEERVTAAYDCLEERIDSAGCTKISTEEKIFSLLALDKCETEVITSSNSLECWPKNNCDLKTTSQAILALNENTNEDTTDAEDWLIEQKATPTDLIWYLEIDTLEASKCEISYSTTSDNSAVYEIDIGENKKLSGDGGSCLDIGYNGYFLEINQNCYEKTFDISCDEDFITTLLYQKENSNTLYVLKYFNGASAGGITSEKINSYCFASGGVCDYEGSLWAAFILDSKGYDIAAYMPYIIGGAEGKENLLPEVFIYFIKGYLDYRTTILEGQIAGKYWQAGTTNDKYYDTPLALLPFQWESSLTEKISTEEWLLEEAQEDSGCWDGKDIVNNAFILYSLFPEFSGSGGGNGTNNTAVCGNGICEVGETFENCPEDCEDTNSECIAEGYYCVGTCNGTELAYECPDSMVCCDSQSDESCGYLGGLVCKYGEVCFEGTEINTADLGYGETCCMDGTCEDDGSTSDLSCEEEGYFCMSSAKCEGEIFYEYDCAGLYLCCSEGEEDKTCTDLGGEICTSSEYCDGDYQSTSDLGYKETCCITGECIESGITPIDEYNCEPNGGVCEIYGCDSGYEETSQWTCKYGDTCCIEGDGPGSSPTPSTGPEKGKAWIWIIFALIVLVLVGILFRDKLRMFLMKIKGKKKGPSGPRFGDPRGPGPRPMPPRPSPTPRRIMPGPSGGRRPMPPRRAPPKASGELNDVLKKLKDMSK